MRLIDKHELLWIVPYSLMHIGRLERAGTFPKRVTIGENRVAWVESEIEAWCQARIDERDAANSGMPPAHDAENPGRVGARPGLKFLRSAPSQVVIDGDTRRPP